jgi:hypothetical protein
MAKEHIAAGSKVAPGTFRCNASANHYECTGEENELPMCPVCDSVSWRTFKLEKDASMKSHEQS